MTPVDPHLKQAFGDAAPVHYDWQTRSPYVAERERELCAAAFEPLTGRVLDLGCAEGATLFHLQAPPGAVGIDLFPVKVAFAARQLPQHRFAGASAYALPFRNQSFDHVLVRDVIHHLDEPLRMFAEVKRVLGRGGRVDVLEPCRYNPLILAHAITQPAERGELRSTPGYLAGLLRDAGFTVSAVNRHQPLPLHRLVFHPTMGKPGAAEGPLGKLVGGVEKAAALLPRVVWAYVHVRARLG